MRDFLFLGILTLFLTSCAGSQWPSSKFIKKNSYQVVEGKVRGDKEVDRHAMYPNGWQGVNQHIVKNISYPEVAVDNGIEGKVFLSFVVNKDGYVADIEVLRSAHPLLDEEAVRVIRSLERWIPAYMNGEAVKVEFGIPVNFKLSL